MRGCSEVWGCGKEKTSCGGTGTSTPCCTHPCSCTRDPCSNHWALSAENCELAGRLGERVGDHGLSWYA